MTELTVRVMNPQPVPEAFMDGQARAIAAFEGVLRGIIARRALGVKFGNAGALTAPKASRAKKPCPISDANPAHPSTFPALPRNRRRVSSRAYSAFSAAGIGRSMIGRSSSVSVQQGCRFKTSPL